MTEENPDATPSQRAHCGSSDALALAPTTAPQQRTRPRAFDASEGTALDPFGHTEERRAERRWIVDYERAVDMLLQDLSAERLNLACDIARIAQDIRGFGHVKERHFKAAQQKFEGLLAQWKALSTSATTSTSRP